VWVYQVVVAGEKVTLAISMGRNMSLCISCGFKLIGDNDEFCTV
jgi:hypothetical protein